MSDFVGQAKLQHKITQLTQHELSSFVVCALNSSKLPHFELLCEASFSAGSSAYLGQQNFKLKLALTKHHVLRSFAISAFWHGAEMRRSAAQAKLQICGGAYKIGAPRNTR